MPFAKFYPHTAAEEIEKAIKFIKARQFHAGFPEISSPHKGGEIEVSIEPDQRDSNIFHIMFKFSTVPGNQTILKEFKQITYQELRRFAAEYDKDKQNIDTELLQTITIIHKLGP